jgi:hypothetical protein
MGMMGESEEDHRMSNMAIGSQQPQMMPSPTAARKTQPSQESPKLPSGWEVSVAPTFSAGRFDGEKTVLFGGKVEVGKEVAGSKLARVAIVGDLHGGIGNGLNSGFGVAARGELGARNLNVYGSVGPQINMGISMNGLTAGAGIRTAAGVQAGKFYAEVAKDVGSNMNMTTAAVGVRLKF